MFHVNPTTGDAGPCRALSGKCPFGGLNEHFTSIEGARAYYEKLKEKEIRITGTSTGKEMILDIPERNLRLAEDSIAAANRRLEKAGVDERFTYELEEYMGVKTELLSGITQAEPRVKITLNTPSVKFEGYTFLAAVEKAEAGFVVKAASGVDLGSYSPDSLSCDACGKSIGRQKTYLVKDSEGRLLQIGSSCVKNYFGVEPKGLWALTYDPIVRARNNDQWNSNGGPRDAALPTEDVLAYALAVSEGGEKFVSGSSASNYGGLSTAEQVKNAIWSRNTDADLRKVAESAQGYRAEAKRLLDKLKQTDTSTAFGRNLSVIANGEWTRYDHMNILIGGLSEIAREKRQTQKDAHSAKWGTPTPGYAGGVGDKISGSTLKVHSVRHETKVDPYSFNGAEKDVTRVTFRDEDNHELVWWASKHIEVEEDEVVKVKSGTIKKLGSYNGVDQTTLKNVRLEGF